MVKTDNKNSTGLTSNFMDCCQVESVIGVDERGQMVMPKELRKKAGINAGDKLAVVTSRKGDDVCCIMLIKTEYLSDMVKNFLGPATGDINSK